MGSHGGATAEGQREMLAELGVTESVIGCEIRSSMDVIEVGRTDERDVPVVADANAADADAIVPINRIKPHTDFSGSVESGLSKMLVIGMGKQRGAKIAHDWAVDWSLRDMIPEITAQLLANSPSWGASRSWKTNTTIRPLSRGSPRKGFLDREAELLETAYDIMPKVPFPELDVLILDQQGKDVSGQGMDTNVIGRRPFAIQEPEPETPDIKRIFTRSPTERLTGTPWVWDRPMWYTRPPSEIDMPTTLINALTASTTRGVRLPPAVETDRAGSSRSRRSASSIRRPFGSSAQPIRCVSIGSMRQRHWSRKRETATTSESSKNPPRSASNRGVRRPVAAQNGRPRHFGSGRKIAGDRIGDRG